MSAVVISLPRRVFRKIVIEPTPGGWVARIVGFDPRFRCPPSSSREFPSREMALRVARATGEATGLPVIAVETLARACGPDTAA